MTKCWEKRGFQAEVPVNTFSILEANESELICSSQCDDE